MTDAGEPLARIDGRWFEGVGSVMTAAQILALAGHDPASRELVARGHHGRRLGAEEAVPVQDGPRFETRARG